MSRSSTEELHKKIDDLISIRFAGFEIEKQPGFEGLSRADFVSLLVSVQSNPYSTGESAGTAAPENFHFETFRCTTRLYCLSLLHQADLALKTDDIDSFKRFYHLFIEAQRSDPDKNPLLSEASFRRLTEHLAKLDADQQKALVINTIISSLVLTPAVKELMKQVCTDTERFPDISSEERAILMSPVVQNDSISFLKQVCGSPKLLRLIYPFVTPFGERAIAYASKAFSAGHLRWYLYTEGNDASPYNDLRDKLISSEFTPEVLQSWFCYWLINIVGFRGHENNEGWRGARYMNQDTFDAIEEFMHHLAFFTKQPAYPILTEWLEARALKLKLTLEDPRQRLFLAHLACLTRSYDASAGKCLEEGFNRLPEELRRRIAASYNPLLTAAEAAPAAAAAGAGGAGLFTASRPREADTAIPVSTYLPQIFSNIEKYVFKKTADPALAKKLAVELGLKMYGSAWENYLNLRAEKLIAPELPLNFNGLTTDAILETLFKLEGTVMSIRDDVDFLISVDPAKGTTCFNAARPSPACKAL